jgi:hypothetical protein
LQNTYYVQIKRIFFPVVLKKDWIISILFVHSNHFTFFYKKIWICCIFFIKKRKI